MAKAQMEQTKEINQEPTKEWETLDEVPYEWEIYHIKGTSNSIWISLGDYRYRIKIYLDRSKPAYLSEGLRELLKEKNIDVSKTL